MTVILATSFLRRSNSEPQAPPGRPRRTTLSTNLVRHGMQQAVGWGTEKAGVRCTVCTLWNTSIYCTYRAPESCRRRVEDNAETPSVVRRGNGGVL